MYWHALKVWFDVTNQAMQDCKHTRLQVQVSLQVYGQLAETKFQPSTITDLLDVYRLAKCMLEKRGPLTNAL